MSDFPVPRCELRTERLVLRPSGPADAARAVEIRSEWEVARTLSRATFPPDPEEIWRWFAEHEREWAEGRAYRFAVEQNRRMIGLVDVDGAEGQGGELGYWLERAAWGRGYALEAARRVVRFAFEEVGLRAIKAGHAHDNPASGRVLAKLGFAVVDTVERFSKPRGEAITQVRYALEADAWQSG